LIKDAKPNQEVDFVRYNREFVITVIIITKFDCRNFHTFFASLESLFAFQISTLKNWVNHRSRIKERTKYSTKLAIKVLDDYFWYTFDHFLKREFFWGNWVVSKM